MNKNLDNKKINYFLELRAEILKEESFQLIQELNKERENVYLLKNTIASIENQNKLKINHYQHIINSIYSSSSWKFSYPIRLIKKFLSFSKNKNKKSDLIINKLPLKKLDYQYWIENIEKLNHSFNGESLFIINLFINNSNFNECSATLKSINNLNYKFYKINLILLVSLDLNIIKNLLLKFNNIPNFSIITIENNLESKMLDLFKSSMNNSWSLFLFPGDCIAIDFFSRVNEVINFNSHTQFIYSDEDELINNKRSNPYFKPDFNLHLFLSTQYIHHSFIIKSELLSKINNFDIHNINTQFFQVLLNLIDEVEHQNIIHISNILFHLNPIYNKVNFLNAQLFLNQYLNKNNLLGQVDLIDNNFGLKIKYDLEKYKSLPLVSIIIPTKNALHLLSRCVTSIINKTTYSNFEIIIVNNNSDDEKTLNYLEQISCNFIKVIKDNSLFNYSAINNNAVNHAKGEYICLMNNDTEVITPEWLTEMMSYAIQENIGCVGAKLLYPNNKVQHGGVILGLGGLAGHCHLNLDKDDPGYFNRAQVVQELSAVTAACLVVKKSIYLQVGGLDTRLAIALNDVNFCLDVLQQGYKNIWTPFALLYHFESSTRGFEDTPEKLIRFNQEVNYVKQKWGKALFNDKAYNKNLSLESTISTFSPSFKIDTNDNVK